MSNYIETLPETIKEYFHILSPEIPDFIYEYIEAPEMQRLKEISITPGTDYTNIFNNVMFYSRLAHSIGVSLIVWNFTKDKKQALAGLFTILQIQFLVIVLTFFMEIMKHKKVQKNLQQP